MVRRREPLVSIITLTYNHGEFLRECVESVLAQTYRNWEQVVWDDGSDDPIAEICRAYGDPRIRFYRQDHVGIHGIAQTYNKALSVTRGEVIAILEGDDFWPPDKLESLVFAFEDPDIVLAYGLAVVVDECGNPTGACIPSRRLSERLGEDVMSNRPVGSAAGAMLRGDVGVFTYPCATLVRREALDSIGGFKAVGDGHAVDYATFLALSLLGGFFFSGKVGGYWRRHSGSINSSLNLGAYVHSDYLYALAFADAYGSRLGLTVHDHAAIRRTWRQTLLSTQYRVGKQTLAAGQWGAARVAFCRALMSGSPRIVLRSLVGLSLSFLHCDFDTLLSVARVVGFQKGANRGVRRGEGG
ncbi:MAG: glycosyltransferase family 2 protein [Nitrospira sp.]